MADRLDVDMDQVRAGILKGFPRAKDIVVLILENDLVLVDDLLALQGDKGGS